LEEGRGEGPGALAFRLDKETRDAIPDPVRLRNREALSTVIGEIVRAGESPTQDHVWKRARNLVREADQDRFVEIALRELANLHDGNIARFRLRLSEYKASRKRHPAD
jgi:hypothetical protein